jgi:hypothetical protein
MMGDTDNPMATTQNLWKQIAKGETHDLLVSIQDAAYAAEKAKQYTDQIGTLIAYIDLVATQYGVQEAIKLLDQAEQVLKKHWKDIKAIYHDDTLSTVNLTEGESEFTRKIVSQNEPIDAYQHWSKYIAHLRKTLNS